MHHRLIFIIPVLLLTIKAAGADTSNLEKRIEELERQQAELFLQLNQEQNRVKPFLQSEIRLGGFFETGMRFLDGPRTKAQINAAPHVLGINLAAQLTPRDRFVGQIQTGIGFTFVNPHADPRFIGGNRRFTTSTASTLIVHSYYEHTFTESLNIQAGVGYVPFGIAYRLREPMLNLRRGGDAQMVSQSASSNQGTTNAGIAFPLWMGLHIHGSFNAGDHRFGYNAYTFNPATNSKKLGEGARAWFQFSDLVTIGASAQIGEQNKHTYRSFGGDVDFKMKSVGLTLEYAESTVSGEGNPAPRSYYINPYVEIMEGKVVIYAGADYLDNPTQVIQTSAAGATASAPYKRWDYSVGINWLPHSSLRFRLGYTDHRYTETGTFANVEPDDRNYQDVDLSAVLAF